MFDKKDIGIRFVGEMQSLGFILQTLSHERTFIEGDNVDMMTLIKYLPVNVARHCLCIDLCTIFNFFALLCG